MLSYLLVVGLVVVPGYVYLRQFLSDEFDEVARQQLEGELDALVNQLSEVPAEDLERASTELTHAHPGRLTIIAADGTVLSGNIGDVDVITDFDEHPEIVTALRGVTGIAKHHRPETGEDLLYVAKRFPRSGDARGVIRLNIRQAAVNSAIDSAEEYLNRATAVALSVSLLFSLLAAFVVSRPLKRIAQGARTFATGDFAQPIAVHSNDELGDAAAALRDMVTQLRTVLVSAGSERATLTALLDELPSGVITYGKDGAPEQISGGARILCSMHAADEIERSTHLAHIEDLVEAREQMADHGPGVSVPFDVPWTTRHLEGRWVKIYAEDGDARFALIVVDRSPKVLAHNHQLSNQSAAQVMRRAASEAGNVSVRAELEAEADRLEDLAASSGRPSAFGPTSMQEIIGAAVGALEGRAQLRKTSFKLEIPEEAVFLADANGVTRRALTHLLGDVIRASKRGTKLTIKAEVREQTVRLSVRTRSKGIDPEELALVAEEFGGEAGTEGEGDHVDVWVAIPRA